MQTLIGSVKVIHDGDSDFDYPIVTIDQLGEPPNMRCVMRQVTADDVDDASDLLTDPCMEFRFTECTYVDHADPRVTVIEGTSQYHAETGFENARVRIVLTSP